MVITIPESIAKRIREVAERLGVTPEEYILDLVTRDLDPEERAREYIKAVHDLVAQAREELEKGDLRQASEKVWGACALAVKAHALTRKGLRLESHRDLWLYKNEMAKELGDWVRAVFRQADSMHKNFYEELATREDVEDSLKEVEKLVTAISRLIEKQS